MDQRKKDDAQARLDRIAGQIGGIGRMIDEGRSCVEILTQVAALRAAVNGLATLTLTAHIEGCLYGEDEEDACTPEARASHAMRQEEIKAALKRLLK